MHDMSLILRSVMPVASPPGSQSPRRRNQVWMVHKYFCIARRPYRQRSFTLIRSLRMKIEQTNLLLEAAAPAPDATPLAVWGLALLAIVLAALALAVVWVKGDLVRIQGIEEKKTASLWILGVLVAIFMLHICASEAGAYRAMG